VKDKNSRRTKTTMTRTVKISDVIHHKIRVLSVQKRLPMQEFIECLLVAGLRDKAYEKFLGDAETQKTATA
jgi:hypothetical protein